MSKMMSTVMSEAIRALLYGIPYVVVHGQRFPIQHKHSNQYGVMTPYGEIIRLVRGKDSVEAYVA